MTAILSPSGRLEDLQESLGFSQVWWQNSGWPLVAALLGTGFQNKTPGLRKPHQIVFLDQNALLIQAHPKSVRHTSQKFVCGFKLLRRLYEQLGKMKKLKWNMTEPQNYQTTHSMCI